MTTQGAQSSGSDIGGVNNVDSEGQTAPQPVSPDVKRPRGKKDRAQFILYAIATVAAIGLVTTLVGVYFVDNDTVIVVGALTVIAAATVWIVGAFALLVGLVAWQFKSDDGDPPQQSRKG